MGWARVVKVSKIISTPEDIQRSKDLEEVRDRIKNNIEKLIKHRVLNSTILISDDQEFVKNNLETVLVLIGDFNLDQNIGKFLNLFVTQTQYLIDNFDDLLKLKNVEIADKSRTAVKQLNFLNDPFGSTGELEFENKQSEEVLVNRIKHGITSLLDVAKQFHKLYEAVNRTIPPFLEDVMARVNDELVSFRRLRNIADNARTENIYDKAVTKYRELEKSYRSYFYWGLAIILILSICLFSLKQVLVPALFSTIEFWAVKISILLVGITLISYFLKQSAHYQRLADQNYQTQVELQAYPSFMESIPTEEAASVRKELALKYFGREVDGAAHKDMSNLISDQMKSTTEMVKATTEAIKNLKG
nr:hypothetical protein [Acinetobacter pittii]